MIANRGDLSTLKNMYSSLSKEIYDLNTNKFWDERLNEIQRLQDQDGMTKERVLTAISFIPKSARRILDIGAGYGFLEEALSRVKCSYDMSGFDISQKAVENLKKRFRGKFIKGSLYKPPYKKDELFDAILALEVLEHIPPRKIFQVLRTFKKLLVHGGSFILSVPLNEGLRIKKDNPSGHVREYTKELIVAELLLAGFKVIKYHEMSAFKSFYRLKRLIQKAITIDRWQTNDIVIQAIKP